MISLFLLGCGTVHFYLHSPPAEDSEADSEVDTSETLPSGDSNDPTDTAPEDTSTSTPDSPVDSDTPPPSYLWQPGDSSTIWTIHYTEGERDDVPMQIYLGDADGDGHEDLLFTSVVNEDFSNGIWSVPYKTHFLQGDGAGNFSELVSYLEPISTDGYPSSDVGDLDQDGRIDLVRGTVNGLSILFGDSAGFRHVTVADASIVSVQMADWNQDGNLDVVGQDHVNVYHLWLGDGAGGLIAGSTFPVPLSPYSSTDGYPFVVGDQNGDGFPDVYTDAYSGQPTTLQNDGMGGFGVSSTPATIGLHSDWSGRPFMAESNGDPTPEVILAYYYDETIPDWLVGTWDSETNSVISMLSWKEPHGYSPYWDDWQVADLNQDGLPDIIRVVRFTDGVKLYSKLLTSLATGAGFAPWVETFFPSSFVTSPAGQSDVLTTGDVNEDGCTDIIFNPTGSFVLISGICS